MIGIQEGYNKNFPIKCIEYYEKFDSLWLFWDMKMVVSLRYEDDWFFIN